MDDRLDKLHEEVTDFDKFKEYREYNQIKSKVNFSKLTYPDFLFIKEMIKRQKKN